MPNRRIQYPPNGHTPESALEFMRRLQKEFMERDLPPRMWPAEIAQQVKRSLALTKKKNKSTRTPHHYRVANAEQKRLYWKSWEGRNWKLPDGFAKCVPVFDNHGFTVAIALDRKLANKIAQLLNAENLR
ncbi:hypothetical protein ANRL3_01865 [Anaerolineae bacterium]|nr:hypothetical protein ANRL3_01865 [Anaerolineae bacterium]